MIIKCKDIVVKQIKELIINMKVKSGIIGQSKSEKDILKLQEENNKYNKALIVYEKKDK